MVQIPGQHVIVEDRDGAKITHDIKSDQSESERPGGSEPRCGELAEAFPAAGTKGTCGFVFGLGECVKS
jgi:hypothetical protein